MAAPRPRQVTIAGWLIIAGSIGALVMIAQQFESLGTLQSGDDIRRVLRQPLFEGVGVTVDGVEKAMRVLGMIAAACATASVILGWQVVQHRSAAARLWLSVLALPYVLAGLGSGGFFSTAAVLGIGLLWLQPASGWLAGTWKPEPSGVSGSSLSPGGGGRSWPPPQVSDPTPPPAVPGTPVVGSAGGGGGAGQGPDSLPPPMSGWPPPYAGPGGPVVTAPAAGRSSGAVPRPLVVAAILTWIFSTVTAGMVLLAVTAFVADPGPIMDRMREVDPDLMAAEGVTVDLIRGVFIALAVGIAVWSVSACVLAVLVVRRVAWARLVLMVSAGCAGLILVAGTMVYPLLVAPLVACGVTIALLARRDVGAWLTASRQ